MPANVACVLKSINQLEKLTTESNGDKNITKNLFATQLAYAGVLVALLTNRVEQANDPELTEKEEIFLREKSRLPLIKSLRERKGWGLLEAKQHSDKLFAKVGYGYIDSNQSFQWYPEHAPTRTTY